ncbi:DNA replication/repair protein RecF [Jiella sp. M17.18]|uniref:DNA replication/repair protein RecF n=1 Tax=Jiella sp. M17.18 TaxID=3234247 RepID=UPI0034DF5CBA
MPQTADDATAPRPAPAVRATSLRLADFRNYDSVAIGFERAFVAFFGENGAGKTNLIEALSLLSPGRGLRRATYGDMIRQGGSGGFHLRAAISSVGNPTEIVTQVRPDPGGILSRTVKIDETPARTGDELLEIARVLWLTPAMDGLFTGPAGDRRRFLDRMVLAVDPGHGRRAADFERAMRSRNKLLSDNRLDDSWLSGLEAQMAELGVAMALARADFIRMMAEMIARGAADSPFPAARLALSSGYDDLDLSGPALDVEDAVRGRLRAARYVDRSAGRTREGAHRADLQVIHAAKEMPAALASTGEQKALLIGLVLAHARLTAAVSGLSPILLLDEIAAHLDPGRRAALFDLVETLGVQTFMTGTDASLFDALGDRAQMLRVSAGRVEPA